MQHHQENRGRRQQQHVQSVEPRKRHHADGAFAAQQARQVRAQHRRLRRDLRGDHGPPVCPVVPRQQVAGESVSQGEQQQHHSHHPGGFARLLVRPVQEDLHHVEHHHHDDHAGAPVVQPAHQPAGGQFRQDVAQAVIGIARRGRVVEGQQRAREGLHHEQEHGDAAEYLVPAAGGWNLFVEELAHRTLYAGAMVHPFVDPPDAAPHDFFSAETCSLPSSSLVPFSLVWYRSSGRGAGPDSTLPSIENSEVWQGQRNSFLASSQW